MSGNDALRQMYRLMGREYTMRAAIAMTRCEAVARFIAGDEDQCWHCLLSAQLLVDEANELGYEIEHQWRRACGKEN